MPDHATAYVGLGANLGQREETILAAINAMHALPATHVLALSGLYNTKPVDADGGDYINAVVALRTQLAPEQLLASLHAIEDQFGRTRSYRNAPRSLDCDLLLYDQMVIHSANLIIPHPRMHQRAFVLLPLLEITPAIHIPGLGPAQSWLLQTDSTSVQRLF